MKLFKMIIKEMNYLLIIVFTIIGFIIAVIKEGIDTGTEIWERFDNWLYPKDDKKENNG